MARPSGRLPRDLSAHRETPERLGHAVEVWSRDVSRFLESLGPALDYVEARADAAQTAAEAAAVEQTSVTGNAGTVTVADAGSDASVWLVLAGSQTGDQGMKTSGYLKVNTATGTLTAEGGLYTDGIIQSTKEPISAIFYGEVVAEWGSFEFGHLTAQYDETYAASRGLSMGSSGAIHRGIGALTGNITINLYNVTSGSKGYVAVVQDGTGGRTVTLTTNFGTLMRDTLCADLVAETAANAVTIYEIEGFTLAGSSYTKVRKIAMVVA